MQLRASFVFIVQIANFVLTTGSNYDREVSFDLTSGAGGRTVCCLWEGEEELKGIM